MFCFQCEQTAKGYSCCGNAGVCGKSDTTANLQDQLTGTMIDLANAILSSHRMPTPQTTRIILEGLFTTITNVSFDNESIVIQIEKTRQEQQQFCQTNSIPAFDMQTIWNANEDIRSLKSLILFGIRGMAAYAYHALVLGYTDDEVNDFFYQALQTLSQELSISDLLSVVLKTGQINFKCMALLDKANTEIYRIPQPTKVSMTIEKGSFIVVSGHDLYDLHQLLLQTQGKGINIYTHSEMLPAHAYPKLKAFPHLKGNFGTAWQSQQKEFDNIPAPILFTTNCLMPIKNSYQDRVFTTEVVAYPEIMHIGPNKDFAPLIKKRCSWVAMLKTST